MPKIRDRATICWTDVQGNAIKEEVVTYELDEEDEEEEEKEDETPTPESSTLTFEIMNNGTDEVEDALEQFMLTFIMDDLLEKLAILRCTAQGEYPPMTVKFPEYKTMDERYGQAIDYQNVQYSESMKRYADLNMVYSVIHCTLEELTISGSYAPLSEGTRIIKKLCEDEEKMVMDEEESRVEEDELRKQLRNYKKELEMNYNDKLEQLRLLELAHESAIAYGKLEYKYLQNWEAARLHQASVIQERDENNFRDIISTNRTKIELENRIHGELVRFFNENAEELTNETSYWMYRYETEMEVRDSELLKLRMDRDAQMEKYMQLKASYESQKEFIEYWGNIKEERRVANELLKMQNAAAKKIQDWWRRTMKRLRLGPYRKGKKGKKGKGKAAKKKK